MIVSFDFVFSYVVVVNSTKSIYIDRNLLWSMNDWLTILIVLIDHGCQFCRWRKKFLTNKQKKNENFEGQKLFFSASSFNIFHYRCFFLNIITLNCFVSIFFHEDSVFIYGFFFGFHSFMASPNWIGFTWISLCQSSSLSINEKKTLSIILMIIYLEFQYQIKMMGDNDWQ